MEGGRRGLGRGRVGIEWAVRRRWCWDRIELEEGMVCVWLAMGYVCSGLRFAFMGFTWFEQAT